MRRLPFSHRTASSEVKWERIFKIISLGRWIGRLGAEEVGLSRLGSTRTKEDKNDLAFGPELGELGQ